ncbi:MAG: T9SS type A sorting domain-containing protein [Chloroherpetonaceae bacterium]|nr:T9SS type A sorting domain-containing protein [bacterium]
MFKINLKIVMLALMMFGQAVLAEAQTQDSSRLLWSRNIGEVIGAMFSPDGEKLVVAVSDAEALLLSVETGEIIDTLKGFGSTGHMEFSKDGRYLYNYINKYDMQEHRVVGKILDSLKPLGIGAVDMVLSPTKDEIYVAARHIGARGVLGNRQDSNLVTMPASTLQPKEYKTINARMDAVNITPDGKFIITLEFDTGCCYGYDYPYGPQEPLTKTYALVLRDAETLERSEKLFNGYEYGVIAKSDNSDHIAGTLVTRAYEGLVISPDGKIFATQGGDSIYIWSTEDWKPIGGFLVPYSNWGKISFSCNSKYLFARCLGEDSNKGMTVYSVRPPFEKVYQYPDRDQNGQRIGAAPEDINCTQNKIVASRAGSAIVSLFSVPDFIMGVKPKEGPKGEDIVYPNPTNGDVRIAFYDELTEPAQVQISNGIGSIIYSAILDPGSKEFQWNTLAVSSGMYICTVKSTKMFKTYKIMVSR